MTSSNGTPDSKQLVARGRKGRKRNVVSEEEEKEEDGGERDKEQQQLEEEGTCTCKFTCWIHTCITSWMGM